MFDRLKTAYNAAKTSSRLQAVELFSDGSRFEAAAKRQLTGTSRAQSSMADRAVSLVVSIVVAGLMAAFLLPIAIEEISSVDTTSWDSDGAAALWLVLPVLIVLAIFLFFVNVATDGF